MQTITKDIQPYTKLPKGEFVSLSQDYAGQLLILMSINSIDNREQINSAGFVETNLNQQQTYQIWQTTDDSGELSLYVEITAKVGFHNVQRFTNGDILLANNRSQYRSENDYDKNGYIYSVDGVLRQQFLLGDGIAEIHMTKDDITWISYFDQGILGCGGYDWYDPIGSSGLVAWNIDGEKLYEFEPSSSLHIIEDCYALNVSSNNDTYVYYFYNDDNDCGEFDLVRIQNQNIIDYWHMPVSGSSAFIIHGNKAVFDGGYHYRTLFYLVELRKDHQAQIMQQIVFEHDGENILKVGEKFSYPWARGDSFVVIKNRHLFVIPFAEFLS
ncbi:hypothetical protein [Psychrobacter sp. DAB_AL43B]|uniref:hypothetical protein n=1 Tax=Psychrobacter sp. DAB_AL43B TaxID=1028416 RepID=UPI0009A5EA58|nr:hypothetical protein [Psychrobacter sp. DAB_AL43B]SLJ84170.1 hypothetical protein DABAL43B_0972 [Psychrobacter sp. DAB_AL43B]